MLKSDKLIDAIGMIDESMVRDAREFEGGRSAAVKKVLAFAAVFALCIVVSVPVLAAAEVEPAQELLYALSPSIAQRLKPVKKSCVDNGMQMEVISADISGNTAEIYISIKDLEGERIDGTADLSDSYDIRPFGEKTSACRLVGYNEEMKEATFLLEVRQTEGMQLDGEKVTFSVSKILSHKETFEGALLDQTLSFVSDTPKEKENVSIGSGSMDGAEKFIFLKPEKEPLAVPINGAEVSAIGHADGKLYVQMYYKDLSNADNQGSPWLEDQDKTKVECEKNLTFGDGDESGRYEEYVFDIPYEELGNYKLCGELICGGTLTEGDWQVTFPVGGAD